MKARANRSSNCKRPQMWSALLSMLVALSLVVQPQHLCALMESAPGHSHEAVADHHHDHHHAGAAHREDGQATFSPTPDSDDCCSSRDVPSTAAISISRVAQPNGNSIPVAYVVATLPTAQDIFALTCCHGRDGPPGQPLRSQFSPSSLLGRAPPISA